MLEVVVRLLHGGMHLHMKRVQSMMVLVVMIVMVGHRISYTFYV